MTNQATALNELDGIQLPQPGVWEIDQAHSSVEFVARHLMVAKVRGRFEGFQGSVTIGVHPGQSAVNATIDAASINTANEQRDGHLRSPDFLDVERFPTLRFRSTSVKQSGGPSLLMTGDLTIKDVTKPVDLEVTFEGVTSDPFGNTKAVFSAETEIDREEFGITWNQALETGGVLVGKRVKIQLEISTVLKA